MVPIKLDNLKVDLTAIVLVIIIIQVIILINGSPGERLMDSFAEMITIAIGWIETWNVNLSGTLAGISM